MSPQLMLQACNKPMRFILLPTALMLLTENIKCASVDVGISDNNIARKSFKSYDDKLTLNDDITLSRHPIPRRQQISDLIGALQDDRANLCSSQTSRGTGCKQDNTKLTATRTTEQVWVKALLYALLC
jgi:hypothetical protein